MLRDAVAAGQIEYLSNNAFFDGHDTYDVIFARFVLEHVGNPREFVESLYKRLNSGGLLVIEVPNWNSVWRRIFGKYHGELCLPTHTFHFEPETLRSIMTGFRCEVREDIHGLTLGKTLGHVFGISIGRTSPISMLALGIEILVDNVIGPPANMTLLATKL
jgi:SAM-dependent methyltransferase